MEPMPMLLLLAAALVAGGFVAWKLAQGRAARRDPADAGGSSYAHGAGGKATDGGGTARDKTEADGADGGDGGGGGD